MEGLKQKKISCHIITFNHKDYISQCIEGLIIQRTNFSFEIIIGDDNSTDGTREILVEYALKYPDIIKLNLRSKRGKGVPGKQNFLTTLAMCKGQYVSLCDGDDYWTDPLKLQKQVDFLEANPDYAICYHKVKVLKNEALEEDTITQKVPETTTIKDLAKGNYIHTCSVVFRNNLFDKLPKYFDKSPVGDYFLHMLNARYGKIKFIDEYMGVYRLHETSVWSSKAQAKREQIWLNFLRNIRKNFDKEVQNILDDQIRQYQKLRDKRIKARFVKIIKSFFCLKK
ncbi:glycosyltransferase [Flavobacterium johnsoniae]|uniref:Glycosyltransferase involved in cell wall bisynthesis n=1 Tax=Flavobacterium johnsoniae TaxID=986 RepID=A0A1M5L2C2_FLAJO|nr:glycosyltransferase [Flavobacterium johnsoniae]SHG59177.1 Glycosyltransferase involved in cell wall bisynthesis [Flavobacterium johnsoniae]